MVRPPCCSEINNLLKRGPWTEEEDAKLVDYISKHGHGNWRTLPQRAGLNRCGKSCRLRWANYLRPDIKRGNFSEEEEQAIINLHSVLGNKWSKIASHISGRTDNEIKNFWNTRLRKKLLRMGIDPNTHKPRTDQNHLLHLSHQLLQNYTSTATPWHDIMKLLQADVNQLAKIQLLQDLLQTMNIRRIFQSQNRNSIEGLLTASKIAQSPSGTTCQEMSNLWPYFPNVNYVIGNSLSSSYDVVDPSTVENRHQLPALVSAASSASPETSSTNYQVESKAANQSNNHSSDVFEAWEKLLDDDGTSGTSYWKEILDLTSSSQ